MSICPSCGHENIDGVDECEKCLQPLGFLSKRRAASALEKRILQDRIRSLDPRKPLLVSPDTTVSAVLNLLVEEGVGCVLIAEGEQVVGIFSERDALMRLNTRFADLADRPIFEFMTHSPETLELDDRIAFALHKMDLGGYRHIPVLDGGRIAGVISVRDMLRYVSQHSLTEAV